MPDETKDTGWEMPIFRAGKPFRQGYKKRNGASANYFQALKINNQTLKINNQALKIYFQALKIVLRRAGDGFVEWNENLCLPLKKVNLKKICVNESKMLGKKALSLLAVMWIKYIIG